MPWEIPNVVDKHWTAMCRRFERIPDPLPHLTFDPPMTYYNNVKVYPSFIPYDLVFNYKEGYDPRTAREDRRSMKPIMENIFEEEEKKYIPVTSQLSYGRPLLLKNVLDWSVRQSKSDAIKDFYRQNGVNLTPELEQVRAEQNETDDDSSSDYSDSAPSVGSNHSLTSGEESESKATDSDATSASYSSLEDEEADRENNVRETMTSPLTSKDIANGNTDRCEEFKIAPGGLSTNCSSPRAEKTNGNEEPKRKLESISGINTGLQSEYVNSSSYMSRTDNSHLPLTPSMKRKTNDVETVGGVTARMRPNFAYVSLKTSVACNEEDGQIDYANGRMLSSDSESPTDPTVQETKIKTVKSAAVNI